MFSPLRSHVKVLHSAAFETRVSWFRRGIVTLRDVLLSTHTNPPPKLHLGRIALGTTMTFNSQTPTFLHVQQVMLVHVSAGSCCVYLYHVPHYLSQILDMVGDESDLYVMRGCGDSYCTYPTSRRTIAAVVHSFFSCFLASRSLNFGLRCAIQHPNNASQNLARGPDKPSRGQEGVAEAHADRKSVV